MCGRFTQAFTWAEVVAFYQLVDEIAPSSIRLVECRADARRWRDRS